jgi:serine/threonine protein kinase
MEQLSAGTKVGEYRVIGRAATGGMGTIYEAEHPVIGKKVAIKVIGNDLSLFGSHVERFVEEARAVSALGHPNIVDVFTFGTLPDGRCYFVMEWLAGETLAQRIARGAIDLPEAVSILDQIADALEAVHEKGMVHRDLKPDNVVLVPVRSRHRPWRVKLLDFGLAKLWAARDPRRTIPGLVLGTPEYLSPEQVRGHAVSDKADIYAFACLAYEVLCGRVPFDAEAADAVMTAHVVAEPPPAASLSPRVPEAISDLLLHMLAKDPACRPSLALMRDVLAAAVAAPVAPMFALGSAPLSVAPPPPAAPETPGTIDEPVPELRPHLRWARLAAAAAAATAAVAAAAWLF